VFRLAAAGARVIKIERAEGDFARAYDSVVNGESAYFIWLNHGKESLVLALKDNRDRDLLLNIISRADVFIQNLAPGAAARRGLGSESLTARFPRLVTFDISGYGESGPYRDMKAYDLLVKASIAFGSLNSVKEFSQHPQLSLLTVDTAAGAVELIAPPGHVDVRMTRSRVPVLGEHSEAIQAEFSVGVNHE